MDQSETQRGSMMPSSPLWKVINIATLVAILCLAALVFLQFTCGLSRSPLIQDENHPRICKQGLECMYYCQKDTTCVNTCATHSSDRCGKFIVNAYCRNAYPVPVVDLSKLDNDAKTIALLKIERAKTAFQNCKLAMH